MAESDPHSPENLLSPTTDGDERSLVVDSATVSRSSEQDLDGSGDGEGTSGHSDALARGISALMTGIIRDLDSKALDTSRSQDQLSCALDRLTRELDQLLDDAPVPFIMQHAARISGVRKRASSLNLVLRSIQRRLDNVDRLLDVGSSHARGTPSCRETGHWRVQATLKSNAAGDP